MLKLMFSRMNLPQKVMSISFGFILVGIFAPWRFYIFGSIGILGMLIGYIWNLVKEKKTNDEGIIDVDIEVSDPKPMNFDDKLRKLEKLKEDGLLTEEEYNRKRSEILKTKW